MESSLFILCCVNVCGAFQFSFNRTHTIVTTCLKTARKMGCFQTHCDKCMRPNINKEYH